jgi:hypothetical protein
MLQMFSQNELDLIIYGVPDINVDDFQRHCKINTSYNSKHKTIVAIFFLFRRWDKQLICSSPVGVRSSLSEDSPKWRIGINQSPSNTQRTADSFLCRTPASTE